MKPRLVLRALNESRRLDPLAYLSLRYAINSATSLRDSWAQQIAPEIVKRRSGATYLQSLQYKQLDADGIPQFRDVYRPGGPEALAEVALLEACAQAGGSFVPAKCVYSYRFVPRRSTEGVFVPYFSLFSERQAAIRDACRHRPKHWVVYADIKQFYPSISRTRARAAWMNACKDSSLDQEWQHFGTLLLKRQYSLKKGLLIGPLFSHVVANLVLSDVDRAMSTRFPGRFFRYVDDFAIVVPPKKKQEALSVLKAALKKLGLKLHPKKTFQIGSSKWLENAPFLAPQGYEDEPVGDEKWMRFVDHVKCYLIRYPDRYEKLRARFKKHSIRLPIPRYLTETMSSAYSERHEARLDELLMDESVKKLTRTSLTREALALREFYDREFRKAWTAFTSVSGLIRRWKISPVRYLLTRILLIGSLEQIRNVYSVVKAEKDVSEYSAMYLALLTGDVDSLLPFGWKVAASIGQIFDAASVEVVGRAARWKDSHIEAYVSLLLSGANVRVNLPKRLLSHPRLSVTIRNPVRNWADSPDSFFREFSALATRKELADHQRLLRTPADPDERWEVFADELIGWEPT